MEINKYFEFEKEVIDVILTLIKDNQEYLTQKENLPQLAKLGYMYNTLFYGGRVAWSKGGELRQDAKRSDLSTKIVDGTDDDPDYKDNYYDCQENPKYKIEMCEPINEVIENLIYDAWGMHVSNESEDITSFDFIKKIKAGRELSDLEVKMLKVNKTFEDWVEIKTDDRYRYRSLYPDRKSVANHLLCVIGNGYGVNKDGYIIEEAGGADQDKALYGDWENAIFTGHIKEVVDRLLDIPEVPATIDAQNRVHNNFKNKRKQEEFERSKDLNELFFKVLEKNGLIKEGETVENTDLSELHDRFSNLKKTKESNEPKKYKPYYPIGTYSVMKAMMDKEVKDRMGVKQFHQSYIDAGIEVCKEILEHQEEENKTGSNKDNVKFAKKFLLHFGYKEYENEVPKEIDKYKLNNDIKKVFLPLTKTLIKGAKDKRVSSGEYNHRFNNSKDSDYADNCYYFTCRIEDKNLKQGYYNDIEQLKDASFYEVVSNILVNLRNISSISDNIKTIEFYYDNGIAEDDKGLLSISMLIYDKNYQIDFEKKLVEKGFGVGNYYIEYTIGNLIFVSQKPKLLGPTHPHTKTGSECFSTNMQLSVFDINSDKKYTFQFDERRFNIIGLLSGGSDYISNWILNEHSNMKLSDSKYGTYDNKTRKGTEGTPLYVHDFLIWLKNNNPKK